MAAYAYFMVNKQDYYLPDVRDREFLEAFWKGEQPPPTLPLVRLHFHRSLETLTSIL